VPNSPHEDKPDEDILIDLLIFIDSEFFVVKNAPLD